MCSGYSCKSITELNIKKCPEVHGRECAGQGVTLTDCVFHLPPYILYDINTICFITNVKLYFEKAGPLFKNTEALLRPTLVRV